MTQSVFCPDYIKILVREGTNWHALTGSAFYNPTGAATDLQSSLKRHGVTNNQLIIELFRINAGRAGYYLADLKEKNYYYCGLSWEDVRNKLLELGIGRIEIN